MKKICIIKKPYTVLDGQHEGIKAIINDLGSFEYTIIDKVEDVITMCEGKSFDLYIAEAHLIGAYFRLDASHIGRIPSEKLIILNADYLFCREYVTPLRMCYCEMSPLIDGEWLEAEAGKILDASERKTICIACPNDSVNNDLEKIQKTLEKVGPFRYVVIEDKKFIEPICSQRRFDAYLIVAEMTPDNLQALLQVVPQEKLVLLTVDGMFAERHAKPANIAYIMGTTMAGETAKKLQTLVKDIVNK